MDVMDILRTAVRIARDQQIRRLDGLMTKLNLIYPNHPEQVKEAIQLWANYAHSTNCSAGRD